ncbi:L,D-transpeptidase family protein [Streptomyces griseocarneus]|uniref:L,D-transpeptidase family protein n=1 Tax=Streptomyces griseocarneus TaxID=51201 RepID=UPI00167F05A5|nr:L,D-transpeptidase family protein [Streptomyces griseocarneus]MBZ6475104.1 L,D-transpeptidase family protein [Streptomyces griseocarneus]GHG62230.1 hypothetical protein GCM10018779_30760 [Streptomyces griseocarneus]
MNHVKRFTYAVTMATAALILPGPALNAVAAEAPTAPAANVNTGAATNASSDDASSSAARSYTYLSFKKNPRDPSNSRLSLVFVQRIDADRQRTYTVDSWRAGSGNGSKDTCATNKGWLPDGTYDIKTFYNNHNGGSRGVNGISWLLSDHKCHTGKKRTELFIHSEMRPNGTQGPANGGDSPYRWDGDRDYKSNGCIKLKPSDIRELRGYRDTYPKPAKLYIS